MKLVITPEYLDLFDDHPQSFEEIIRGIYIEDVVDIVSFINAQLFLKSQEYTNDIVILQNLIDNNNFIVLKSKYDAFKIKHQQNNSVALFTPHHLIGFLHKCILTCKERKNRKRKVSYTVINIKILRSYIYFYNCTDKKVDIKNIPRDDFYRKTWPLLINQEVHNRKVHPITILIKSVCFFNYFQFELGEVECVNKFLANSGSKDGLNYSYKTIDIIHEVIKSNIRGYLFKPEKVLIPLYSQMAINYSEYKESFQTSSNYTGLKKYPIYKLGSEDGVFGVIDWSFFNNKIYDGLVFDFYHRSGIKKDIKNDFINHYKPKTAEMIEKFLFRKLINKIFKTRRTIVLFDEGVNNFPDAYVRIGNRVFLFEVKDALFSSGAIDSRDYTKIKKVIDEKYNSPKKGTGQILNQLEYLKDKTFESKTYMELKLKSKNLIIYPIIIYTDPHFSVLGMESYLHEEFVEKLNANGINNSFKSIKRLSFINIDFFIEHVLMLQKCTYRLDKLIDIYDKRLKEYKKKYLKDETLESHFNSYKTFEDIWSNEEVFRKRGDKYLSEIFETLELTKGLDIR